MNQNRPKGNQKHIDLSGRIRIEQGLNNGESFRTIARDLNKDPSTISKEVRRHSVIKERKPDAFAPIPCANNYDPSYHVKPEIIDFSGFYKLFTS
jgi:IS30 family transposase